MVSNNLTKRSKWSATSLGFQVVAPWTDTLATAAASCPCIPSLTCIHVTWHFLRVHAAVFVCLFCFVHFVFVLLRCFVVFFFLVHSCIREGACLYFIFIFTAQCSMLCMSYDKRNIFDIMNIESFVLAFGPKGQHSEKTQNSYNPSTSPWQVSPSHWTQWKN